MSSTKHESNSPTLGRRQFCALLAASLAAPGIAWADETGSHVVCYVSVGSEFRLYRISDDNLSLTLDSSVTLPATIQYAWPHPSLRLMYVAYSNRAGSSPGDVHGVAVLRVDERSGRLQTPGAPLRLNNRPISITVDRSGSHLLVGYNDPAQLDVFPLDSGGTPSAAIVQKASIDAGIYAHQVRVAPSDRTVILVTRGNDAAAGKHEDPGAIKVFRFNGGQ
jgi:6-phosphogluconolactonase (cycloisomerase 2 family)